MANVLLSAACQRIAADAKDSVEDGRPEVVVDGGESARARHRQIVLLHDSVGPIEQVLAD